MLLDRFDEEDATKERPDYRRKLIYLLLLLLLLLLGGYTLSAGSVYLFEQFNYNGIEPTQNRKIDRLEHNQEVIEQGIQDLFDKLGNRTAPPCIGCTNNGTLNTTDIVVNNTIVSNVTRSDTIIVTAVNNSDIVDILRSMLDLLLQMEAELLSKNCSTAAFNFTGNWTTNVTYLPGSIVYYNGSYYVSLANNSDTIPDAAPDTWMIISGIGTQGPVGPSGADGPSGNTGGIGAGAWDNTTFYNTGDLVSHNNTVWLAVTNNSGVEPGTDGLIWSRVSANCGSPGNTGDVGPTGPSGPDGGLFTGDWSDVVTYMSGNVVVYNDTIWVSDVDGNTNSTPGTNATAWTQLPPECGGTGNVGPSGNTGGLGDPGLYGAGAWVDNVSYLNTALVTYNFSVWYSQLTNTNVTPGSNSSVWKLMSQTGGPGGALGPTGPTGNSGAVGPVGANASIPYGDWNSNTTYPLYAVVDYLNVTYIALVSNFNATPSTNTTAWYRMNGVGPAGATGTLGPVGPTGPAGASGASVTLNGTWSSASTYSIYSAVTYQGSMYLSSVSGNFNQTPGVSSNWTLYAAKGRGGSTGPVGPGGATGATPVYSGNWSSVVNYTTGELVSYNDTIWISQQPSTNVTPGTNSSYWAPVSGEGVPGPTGPSGSPGQSGIVLTTTNYTQPAALTTFDVNVTNINVVVGQFAIIPGGGMYVVQAISGLQLTLEYLDSSYITTSIGNSVLAGSVVAPAGLSQNATNGTDGGVGPTGPQGPDGTAGAAGPQGIMGPTGPIINGSTGPTGPCGAPGPLGGTGNTGPLGPAGSSTPGANGTVGPVGQTGPSGPTGPDGPSGVGNTGAGGGPGPTGPGSTFNISNGGILGSFCKQCRNSTLCTNLISNNPIPLVFTVNPINLTSGSCGNATNTSGCSAFSYQTMSDSDIYTVVGSPNQIRYLTSGLTIGYFTGSCYNPSITDVGGTFTAQLSNDYGNRGVFLYTGTWLVGANLDVMICRRITTPTQGSPFFYLTINVTGAANNQYWPSRAFYFRESSTADTSSLVSLVIPSQMLYVPTSAYITISFNLNNDGAYCNPLAPYFLLTNYITGGSFSAVRIV